MLEFRQANTLSEKFVDDLWGQMLGEVGSSEPESEQTQKLYEDEGVVVFEGETAVGALLWKLFDVSNGGRDSFISASLGVVPAARGRGIGSVLAQEFKALIDRHPKLSANILADDADSAAHHLARKLGLHVRRKRVRYQLKLTEPWEVPKHPYHVEVYGGEDRRVAQEIATLYESAFRADSSSGQLSPEKVQSFAARPCSAMLCMWDGDRLAGFAGLSRHASEGWIYWIAAGRRWWGKGVSDALSSAIHNHLLAMGCSTADAQADERNFPSRSLMERFGMTVTATSTEYGSKPASRSTH